MRVANHETMYAKILKYAFTRCNVLCVCVRKNNNVNIRNIVNYVSENYVDARDAIKEPEEFKKKLFKNLVNDEMFLNFMNFKKRKKISLEKKEKMNEEKYYYLKVVVDWFLYNHNTSLWLRKYSKKFIRKEEYSYGTEYYIKLNETLKKELINKASFNDWAFPNSVEGICFYKDDKCWLENIFSWKSVHIYCENEKEYNYLKALGISFYEKKFMPIEKRPLRYTMINTNNSLYNN